MNIYYMPFNCIPSPRIKSTGLDFSDLEKSFDENFEKLNESFRLISKIPNIENKLIEDDIDKVEPEPQEIIHNPIIKSLPRQKPNKIQIIPESFDKELGELKKTSSVKRHIPRKAFDFEKPNKIILMDRENHILGQ